MEIDKQDRDVLLKLYNALDLLFKKEPTNEPKNYISPNQTNILDQIKEGGATDEQLYFFLNIKTDEDYYWFVLLLTVYELNRSIHIDSNLQKLVPIINSIDSKNLKLSTLEYQRYKNYFIKPKIYKRF